MAYTPSFTSADLKSRAETEIHTLRQSLDISRNKISNDVIDWSDPNQVMGFRQDIIELIRITHTLDDIISLRQNIDWCPRNATIDILIGILDEMSKDPAVLNLPIYLDLDCSGIDDYVVSYRGIYTNIAIQGTSNGSTTTVDTLLIRLKQMQHNTVYGYKGGEFTTYGITPVWYAHYGKADGRPVLGFELDTNNNCVLLVTGEPYAYRNH